MSSIPRKFHWRAWHVLLAASLLALLFLGMRGLWDPDEGRYTNVALTMLDSGNWLIPQRTDGIGHWTKPPLVYWAIATSIATFGANTWAARLPSALAYLLCVWLVRQISARLIPDRRNETALLFATMFMAAGASQLITTDFLLAACETLAVCGFVCARFGDPATWQRRGWWLAMWLGFGLAFLTKGPPGLLPALALIAFALWVREPGRPRDIPVQVVGVLLFAVVALPWYLVVTQRTPGLLHYFTGSEVVDRVASDVHRRNGEWYGWLLVYGPTLLIGALPWTWYVLRWFGSLPASFRRWWRNAAIRRAEAGDVLVALWILLPLLVFCLSRSRLPLYVLPLFPALAIAAMRMRRGPALPNWWWMVALVIAMKVGSLLIPATLDVRTFVGEIHKRAGDAPVKRVVFIDDTQRYALHLYLGLPARIERVSMDAPPQARFNPDFDRTAAEELARFRGDPGVLWVTKLRHWPQVQQWMTDHGAHAIQLGDAFAEYPQDIGKDGTPKPDDARVMFRVE
ncbi:glycosyltransferase family 39 protein [Solilutibacter silvestris]|uniref:Dolichyl-phosphate-mannose-protein mannosyltransferase n=1 Tax=Solilutibacter silvestris TaxID=1645665 RepID=A0A2K1Q0X3_9GAMM|nr:glycosyltransferase family 39 protein [Lysobacter silvestris]PNS08695.1 Dolichyl-phosphate-mannose-protein mannosyltransferase [Lysobacter silvestris]